MNISKYVDPFLALKRPNTERVARVILRQLEKQHRRWWTIDALQATQFLANLRSKQQRDGTATADATLATYSALLRSLFNHLVRCLVRNDNPFIAAAKAIPLRQKVQKRPTCLVPWKAVRKMLALPASNATFGVRDSALLALLFGAGLRRSEVAALNVDDIHVAQIENRSKREKVWVLRLRSTKAGVAAQQPLASWVAKRVTALVAERHQQGARDGQALFVTHYGGSERMSDKTIERIFKRYAEAAGVVDIAPHSARATFATRLAALGASEQEIADALRHSSTAQVHVYVKRANSLQNNVAKKVTF